jgi:hypothetical protein
MTAFNVFGSEEPDDTIAGVLNPPREGVGARLISDVL